MQIKSVSHALMMTIGILLLTISIMTFMEVQKGHSVLFQEMHQEASMESETTEKELTSLLIETTHPGDYVLPFGAAEIVGELTLTTASTPDILIEEDEEGNVTVEDTAVEETCLAMIVHKAPTMLYDELMSLEMIEKTNDGHPIVLLKNMSPDSPEPSQVPGNYLVHVTPIQEGTDGWGCQGQQIFTDYRLVN